MHKEWRFHYVTGNENSTMLVDLLLVMDLMDNVLQKDVYFCTMENYWAFSVMSFSQIRNTNQLKENYDRLQSHDIL
jgi:hypothetical protein